MAASSGERGSDEFETLFRDVCNRLGIALQGFEADKATILRGNSPSSVYLTNIRLQVMSAPAQNRLGILEHFLRASLSAPTDQGHTFEEVQGRLMPRIGRPFAKELEVPPSRVWLQGRPGETRTGRDSQRGSVTLPALPTLEVNVVVDEAESVWYVRQKHLTEWKVCFEMLLSLATENLRRRTSPSQLKPIDRMPGILACDTGDSYDAARLLVIKDLVVPWPREGVVVAAPVRDLLLCVRLDSMEAVRAMNPMFGAAQRLSAKEGYAITGHAMWFDGTTWEYFPTRVSDKGIEAFPPNRFVGALERLGKPSS